LKVYGNECSIFLYFGSWPLAIWWVGIYTNIMENKMFLYRIIYPEGRSFMFAETLVSHGIITQKIPNLLVNVDKGTFKEIKTLLIYFHKTTSFSS
jgi:hypothetical protein